MNAEDRDVLEKVRSPEDPERGYQIRPEEGPSIDRLRRAGLVRWDEEYLSWRLA